MNHSLVLIPKIRLCLWLTILLLTNVISIPALARENNPPQGTMEVSASPFNNDGSTENTGSYTSGKLSTALGLALSPKDTPQTVSVITRQQMDDIHASSIKDALRWSVGVNESDYDTDRSAFGYRGFKVDIYQYDGVPTFIDPGDKGAIDTSILDRIEIVRGAAGLLNGEGNPGAVINLVRKKASNYSPVVRLNLSGGSWDDYRASVDAASGLNSRGTLRGRLVGAVQRSHSFMDRYQQRKAVIYGTLDIDLTENTLLRLGADYQQDRPQSSTWGGGLSTGWLSDGSEINWPRGFNGAPDWARWNTDFTNQFISLEHEFNNSWKTVVNYAHSNYSYDALVAGSIGGNAPGEISPGFGVDNVIPKYSGYWGEGRTDQHALDLKLNGDFNLFQQESQFVVGGSAGWRRVYATYRDPLVDVTYSGNLLAWNGHIPVPPWSGKLPESDYRTRQLGLYASTNLALLDAWNLILGARYNNFKNSNTTTYGKVTPFIGTTVKLTPQISAYASYTSIFKAQDLRDKNRNFLSPIEGVNKEIGLKAAFFEDRLNISLTGFRIVQQHYGVKDLDSLPAPDESYHESQGASSKGVEFEVSGQLAQGWNMLFGVTHYSGVDLNTQWPRNNVTLFTSYQLPGLLHHLTLAGGARFRSRVYTVVEDQFQGNPVNRQVDQRAYWLVDMMARYAFTPQTSLQLNIDNLLNKKYYADIDDGTRQYGAPRQFSLTLSHEF